MAPGRCSSWLNHNCSGGDSAIEPYFVAHYQLLAHAAVVSMYKTNYQVRTNIHIQNNLLIINKKIKKN